MGSLLFTTTKTAFVTTFIADVFSANLGSFPGKKSLPSIDGHKVGSVGNRHDLLMSRNVEIKTNGQKYQCSALAQRGAKIHALRHEDIFPPTSLIIDSCLSNHIISVHDLEYAVTVGGACDM